MEHAELTRIVEKYQKQLFVIAFHVCRNRSDAEDAVQEAFLKLWAKKPRLEGEEHLRNWLIRVTINECKRSFGAHWRKVEPLEAYADKLTFSSEENSETYRAVMDLPGKYRIVIHLHYYEGYSTAEIAQLLRMKQSTVCTQLERGRKLLKNMLLEADDA